MKNQFGYQLGRKNIKHYLELYFYCFSEHMSDKNKNPYFNLFVYPLFRFWKCKWNIKHKLSFAFFSFIFHLSMFHVPIFSFSILSCYPFQYHCAFLISFIFSIIFRILHFDFYHFLLLKLSHSIFLNYTLSPIESSFIFFELWLSGFHFLIFSIMLSINHIPVAAFGSDFPWKHMNRNET